ncbi:inhibitor of host transcription [Vibrio phage ValKK3]|uniref:Inhibitor of host transcription n=1 Tax=Vibrio phage ValKK3 TaxID=1610855 RepID=A0A0D4DBM2_9CAUD|nr:inhibitor of host transcription [Vibrio phage ValKK3]AJT61042.1 hypothetical protein [Vibrio phage ValKK3]QBX06028.1 hypothetical protein Va3_074 [Vibrio phage Va3]QNJ55039.1 hypothetical protein vBValMR11Z_113 [Vibrio phage vB_ValM_R11Z]
MNVQSLTNEQLAAYFNMTVDSNGFQAVDEKGRRHYLTDLRQKAMKAAKTKKARKVRAEAQPKATAEELLAELQSESSDFWEIRESQPGMDSEEHGLNVYVTTGLPDSHRVMIRSSVLSNKELDRELGHLNPAKHKEVQRRKKSTIIFSNRSAKEIVEIIEKVKSISE